MHLLFAKAVFAALKLQVSLEFGVVGGWGGGQPAYSSELRGKEKHSLSKQWVDSFFFFFSYTGGPRWSTKFRSP